MPKLRLQTIMYRSVPMWVLCLVVLLGLVWTIVFGWLVIGETKGGARSGLPGRVAYAIGSFPTLTYHTLMGTAKDVLDAERFFQVPRESNLKGFSAVKARPGLEVPGLMMRADRQAVARAAGWRILAGAFRIDGATHYGALALSPSLEISHIWRLGERTAGRKGGQPEHRRYLHGMAVLPDGSIIYTFDSAISLQRRDVCGKLLWSLPGKYHHAVTLGAGGKSVWTLGPKAHLFEVDVASGKVLQDISVDDVMRANPGVDIFRIRQRDNPAVLANARNTQEEWDDDRFHMNDVEPLPAAFARHYPGFEAGDLLLSARSLNLVFVIDPRTLKIKWWRAGATRRQHDADWQPDGTVTVLDNRLGLDYSRIVRMWPGTLRSEVLLDGRNMDFYTRIRGKHELTGLGHLLVASAQQGRIFETDRSGRVILDIQNTDPDSKDMNYLVSEAFWFPPDAFDFKGVSPCEN